MQTRLEKSIGNLYDVMFIDNEHKSIILYSYIDKVYSFGVSSLEHLCELYLMPFLYDIITQDEYLSKEEFTESLITFINVHDELYSLVRWKDAINHFIFIY